MSQEKGDEAWKPNSPQNTTSLMKMYALQDNYKEFQTLFLNGSEHAGEDSSKQLIEIATDCARMDSFTLLTFQTGEMVLVHLTPTPNQDGEVLIQDIIFVPEEARDFLGKTLISR